MKNYIQDDSVIEFTAPSGGVTSGQGYLHGSLFGVVGLTAAVGVLTNLATRGVFELAKAAVSWSAGDKLYWDDTAKKVTNVASTNHFIGVGLQDRVSGDALCQFLCLQTGSDDYNTIAEIVAGLAALGTAGPIMDTDFTAAEGILRKVSAGVYTTHKSNLGAAVAPAVGDDGVAGYSVGSVWIDTTADNAYVCVDSSTGAAVWLLYMTAAQVSKLAAIEALADVTDATNVAAAGAVMDSDISPGEGILRKTGAGAYTAHKSNLDAAVAPAVGDDGVAGYSVGSVWIDTTADNAYVCVDSSTGAAVWLLYMTAAQVSKLAAIEAAADVTDATNVAAAGAVMRTTHTNVDREFVASYTCVSGDDTAGYHDFDTAWGSAPEFFTVDILRAGVDVKADAIVTALGGGDAGKIRVADGGITYVMTAGDVVMLRACNII